MTTTTESTPDLAAIVTRALHAARALGLNYAALAQAALRYRAAVDRCTALGQLDVARAELDAALDLASAPDPADQADDEQAHAELEEEIQKLVEPIVGMCWPTQLRAVQHLCYLYRQEQASAEAINTLVSPIVGTCWPTLLRAVQQLCALYRQEHGLADERLRLYHDSRRGWCPNCGYVDEAACEEWQCDHCGSRVFDSSEHYADWMRARRAPFVDQLAAEVKCLSTHLAPEVTRSALLLLDQLQRFDASHEIERGQSTKQREEARSQAGKSDPAAE